MDTPKPNVEAPSRDRLFLEVITKDGASVLVRPDAIDAVAWNGRNLVLYLRGGSALELRDDYGYALQGGPWKDVAWMLGLEVQDMRPGRVFDEQARRIAEGSV